MRVCRSARAHDRAHPLLLRGGGVAVSLTCDCPHRLRQLQFRRADGTARPGPARGRHRGPDGHRWFRLIPSDLLDPQHVRRPAGTGHRPDRSRRPGRRLDAYVDDYSSASSEYTPLTMHAAKRATIELSAPASTADRASRGPATLSEGLLPFRGLHRGNTAFMEKHRHQIKERWAPGADIIRRTETEGP